MTIGWEPIPDTSQVWALDSRCDETLYTGTRGPGKTTVQLMRFARRVGIGYGAYWRGAIFGRSYKALSELVTQSKRFFPKIFGKHVKFMESSSAYFWEWDTGETLMFRQLKTMQEYTNNHHGSELPFIGWHELTQWPTSEMYDVMISCNRSSWTLEKDGPRDEKGNIVVIPDIPLEVFSTTNSEGVGHSWVKSRFIDVAEYGHVVTTTATVFNPRSQREEEIQRTQVTIFGSYRENIYLDPKYIAALTDMCRKNENLRKSWLEGSWDIVSGGAFDDVWNKNKHVIPMFRVPFTFRIDRSLDWGSTAPFSVGWWAEATGETITFPDGKQWTPARGSLIQIGEYYGSVQIGTNKGIKLGSSALAMQIREREIRLMTRRIVQSQPLPGPADNQIRNVQDDDSDTIEKKMADKGVRWTESDKSPGSRHNGLELMREMLDNANNGEGPGLYFCEECRASIATIPVLPRDEDDTDDVDTSAEDHAYDMVRYRVLKGRNRIAKKLNVKFPM